MYEEETDSEPEVEESQYTPDDEFWRRRRRKTNKSKNNKHLNEKIKYSIT